MEVEVKKRGSFNDACRTCGRVMDDDEGCPSDRLCDLHCKLAGHSHPGWDAPASAPVVKKKESSMSSIVDRFNALPIVAKIRAHLNAAKALKGAARTRALEEVGRLMAQKHAPRGYVRHGADEEYIGSTASGTPIVQQAPADKRIPRRADGTVDVQAVLRRSDETIAQAERTLAEINSGFEKLKCSRCGDEFETRTPSTRKVCADCAGKLR